MKTFFLLPFFAFLFACQHQPQSLRTPLSVLQGATDEASTQINIVAREQDHWTFQIRSPSGTITPLVESKSYPPSPHKVITLTIASGLKLGETYRLEVFDKNQHLIDSRFFKSLNTQNRTPKIAVISCTDDHFPELQAQQWQNVWGQNPDLLFMIGDNIYVDSGIKERILRSLIDDHMIWKRYIDSRLSLEVYQMKNLIPTLAAWDDHDFGKNDGDRTFPYKNESKIIFETFFPQKKNSLVLDKGPGTSQRVHLAGMDFIFFDDRFFRSEKNHPEQTHFGKEQEKWFFDLLQKSKSPLWLISGDQFFGAYHKFESYEGNHPKSFQEFLQKIKTSKKTVAFISGDRHVAEVMKIPVATLGYETYELTSSGLHSKMFPGSLAKEKPNTRALFNRDGLHHFMLFEPEEPIQQNQLTFKVKFINPQGLPFYENQWTVKP